MEVHSSVSVGPESNHSMWYAQLLKSQGQRTHLRQATHNESERSIRVCGVGSGGVSQCGKFQQRDGILVVTGHYFLSYDASKKYSFSSDPIYWPMNPKA